LSKLLFRRRTLCLLVLWAHPGSIFAQVTNSVIEGKVLSDRRNILADASVWVRNLEIGLQRLFRTDASGRFRAPLLPLGSYEISARHPRFGAARRDLVLGVAETRSVDLVLGGRPDQEPSRSAPVTGLETNRTRPGTSINTKLVESLPVSGRKFLDLGVMVVGATEFGERDTSATADFAGVNHFYSNMLVDGTDAFQAWSNFPHGKFLVPFEFSQNAVREIQVSNSNFSPEFGRSAGGMVNVITRSGTNAWHGDGFYFFFR
jgi:carboxypeptidase family protein